MKTFTTSDLHFYHKNIIRYCERPFDSVESMNESLIQRWNDVVGPDDLVWFLGDFAFTGKQRQLDLMAALNGRVNVVPGNHDYVIKKLGRQGALPSNFHLYPELLKVKIDDRWFVLSHYPLEEWEGMVSHPSDSIRDSIHLHGHSHGTGETRADRYDVGIDIYGRPVEVTGDLRFIEPNYKRLHQFGGWL